MEFLQNCFSFISKYSNASKKSMQFFRDSKNVTSHYSFCWFFALTGQGGLAFSKTKKFSTEKQLMKLGNIIDRHIIESIQILFAKIFIIRAMRSPISTYILTSVWLVQQYSRSRYKIIINTSICMILSPIVRFLSVLCSVWIHLGSNFL